ncbi:carboxylesterase NlhH-like [Elysia marginata]|uniref:Carboxylesterase NlhH-like n=1 Tax=Elysia marginata TaxID=1093978 RepID=A0AAV4JND9_9GAST|nr:carboxylesterase NlhH-like [Elysia marginata]
MSTAEELWAELAKTYTIHPETLRASTRQLSFNFPNPAHLSIEEMRENEKKLNLKLNGTGTHFDGIVEEIDAGGVPATVYRPTSRRAENPTVMVYFHGGGLLLGSRLTHDRTVKSIAERAGVVVVSVEYRLLPCPEEPMVPFDDALAATRWVMKNRDVLGGAGSKIGVGGDSAGGQLAVSLTHDIQAGLDFMVLVYPAVDFNLDLPSCREFYRCPGFNTAAMGWIFNITNKPIPDVDTNSRVNAAVRQDLAKCPPAVIILAQIDPLRDACTNFAEKLQAAGVPVRLHMLEGVPHGFFSRPGVFPTTCSQAFTFISDFLKEVQ